MPFLPIIPPTLREGFCNTLGEDWAQALINEMGRAVAVFTDVGTIILNQEAHPNSNQRAFLWYKPSTGITYYWDAGTSAWISPHPEPPNGIERRWVEGTPTQILTYDGGDTNPAGTNSGPMWEIDHNYDGRSPMGPGVIPGANPAKTLALSEDFGSGAVAGTAQNVPPHTHPLNADASIVDGKNIKVVTTGVGTAGLLIGGSGPPSTDLSVLANEFTGTQEPSSVLSPIRGIYAIKRTSRVNYVGA